MVREGDWKLIGGRRGNKGKENFSLHRLIDEKPEIKNYAAEQPETVARLRKMHEE